MNVEELKRLLSQNKSELAGEFGICTLGIFGSVAEGRATRSSDVDLFYEMEEGRFLKLQQLDDFEERVRRILHRRKVDLVNLASMNPIVRYRAEKHFIYI